MLQWLSWAPSPRLSRWTYGREQMKLWSSVGENRWDCWASKGRKLIRLWLCLLALAWLSVDGWSLASMGRTSIVMVTPHVFAKSVISRLIRLWYSRIAGPLFSSMRRTCSRMTLVTLAKAELYAVSRFCSVILNWVIFGCDANFSKSDFEL